MAFVKELGRKRRDDEYFIGEIWNHPRFTRAWVRQEVTLAQGTEVLVVVVGKTILDRCMIMHLIVLKSKRFGLFELRESNRSP